MASTAWPLAVWSLWFFVDFGEQEVEVWQKWFCEDYPTPFIVGLKHGSSRMLGKLYSSPSVCRGQTLKQIH